MILLSLAIVKKVEHSFANCFCLFKKKLQFLRLNTEEKIEARAGFDRTGRA